MINENRLFGHDKILKNLINLYDNKSLPNKILLTGKRGIGKSLIVEHLINYIFSQEEDYKYNIDDLIIDKNNRSHILYINNTHPNIFKISKKTDKKNIEVSQIRDLLLFQNRSSFNDKIRCIIIDDAEYLNLSSTSALLKSVEEPNNQIL